MIEIEVKFEISNIRKIQQGLKKIGAKKISKVLQQDISFDDENETFMKQDKLLRVRKEGDNVILAFKSKKKKARFKEAEEIEIKVSDFKKTKGILKRIGFYPMGEFRKTRERWDFKNSEILIDQTALGNFLEIEGTKKEIEEIIKLLELDSKKRSSKTYHELYKEYCKKKGIKFHPRYIVLPK